MEDLKKKRSSNNGSVHSPASVVLNTMGSVSEFSRPQWEVLTQGTKYIWPRHMWWFRKKKTVEV